MALSPTSSRSAGTTLGNVTTVTGTPSAGQIIVATSATAADWETNAAGFTTVTKAIDESLTLNTTMQADD